MYIAGCADRGKSLPASRTENAYTICKRYIAMTCDISAIILTYNEEIHLERCVAGLRPSVREIYIVDSFSTDRTVEIAERLGCKVYQNEWKKNYARQFNWALKNLPIVTDWVLRIDADEYLTPELVAEIERKLPSVSKEISGIVFKRRHVFCDKWIKRGVYPVKLLRLFRYGKADCEQRWMDEHIRLLEGEAVEFRHDFVDHNLNDLSWWVEKHAGYAVREALDLLDLERKAAGPGNSKDALSSQAMSKRKMKQLYVKMPLFGRAFVYFVYRYFGRLGVLEGPEGFLWHFLQGWWYRTLVDANVYNFKKHCGLDAEKIKAYVKKNHGISFEE